MSWFRFCLKTLLGVIAIVPVCLAGADTGEWHYLSQSALQWQPYGKAAFKLAGKSKKPLFVLVYNDRCLWCRKYETESIETDPVLRRLRQDYVPVAVDALQQPALAKALGAVAVPTTVLLTPDRRKIVKFHGFVGERDLTDILDANLLRWRKGEIPAEEFGNESTCCPVEPPKATP